MVPSPLKSECFLAAVAWQLGFDRAAARGHQGAGGPRRASKLPSIKHVRGYEREPVEGWRGSDLVSVNHRRRPLLRKVLFRGRGCSVARLLASLISSGLGFL